MSTIIHIRSIATGVALGSAGIVMMSILGGCESSQQQHKQQNKFLVIEQLTDGKYVVVESMPTEGPSRAIIRERDENNKTVERIMSEEEMKKLAQQEYAKVQNGTSETLQNNGSSAGMGLAGTILAVAAGSLLGNVIGNALMNNKNFASRSSSVNQSAYARPSTPPPPSSAPSDKKSYFSNSSSGTSGTGNTGSSSTASSHPSSSSSSSTSSYGS